MTQRLSFFFLKISFLGHFFMWPHHIWPLFHDPLLPPDISVRSAFCSVPLVFFILFSFLFFVCLFFLNFLSVVLFSSNFHQFSFQTVLLFWITNWYCLLFWQLNTFLVPFLFLTPPQTSTDLGLDSALASVIYLLSHASSLFGIIFILLFERALIQKRMLYFNFFFIFFCKLKDILSWIGGRSLRNCYDSALRRWQLHSRSPPITLCEWFARQR